MRNSTFTHCALRGLAFASALLLAGCAAGYHHRVGIAALEKGEFPKAVKELRQATELAPEDVGFRKDWLQARESAIEKLISKASVALASGDSSSASKHYRAVLEFDPKNPLALDGLETLANATRAADDVAKARDALSRGEYEDAQQWANRALLRAPGQRDAVAVKREIDQQTSRTIVSAANLGALYKKPINLEFRDASVKMVFEALSRTTGINFIFDRDVKGDQRTTVFLKQTTLEDAIDVILTTNQLEKKVLNASSVLIYPNLPAKVKEYQDLVVRAFYPANVEAKQAANLLKTVLKLNNIFVDDKYNMLVLREPADTIVLAEKLIALQDLDEPEVMLEVEVLEVNRSRLLNLGIQFTDQLTVSPLGVTGSGSTGNGTASTPTLKLSEALSLNKDRLSITAPSATINIQKIDGDANLLANPRLRVRDREKAKILIGDKVPVVTTTASPNGFLSENVQYLDVGLKLEVEPEIHLRDEIGLKMSLEVSSLVSVIKTASGSQAYQIGTRNVTTSLRLRDGETQVLAGLISDADRSSANRIPLVGQLPLLGRLFSSQKDDRQKTEIVMSITPHLIRNKRRKDPATESFWSGTEASLRTRALVLGSAEPGDATAGKSSAGEPAGGTPIGQVDPAVRPQLAAADTSGIGMQWKGPGATQVGQVFITELMLSSAHALRAMPIQLAYDPTQLEIVAVKEGEFFNKSGASSFNSAIDPASGRVSISAAGKESGAQGEGRMFSVTAKALRPGESEIAVIGMTPIGARQAVSQPVLPVMHKTTIVP